MKRRFIVAGDMSAESEKAFIAYIRGLGIGWWHRIPNFWLLITSKEEITATSIRDFIFELSRKNNKVLVMEIDEDKDWATILPENEPGTFDWVKKAWAGE